MSKRMETNFVPTGALCACGQRAFVKCLDCVKLPGGCNLLCGSCDEARHTSHLPFHDRHHFAREHFELLTPTTTIEGPLSDVDPRTFVVKNFLAYLPTDRGCPNPTCSFHGILGSMALVDGCLSLDNMITFILPGRGSFKLCAAKFICTHCLSTVDQRHPFAGTNSNFFPASPCMATIHLHEGVLHELRALQATKPSMGAEPFFTALSSIGKRARNADDIDVRLVSEAAREFERMTIEEEELCGVAHFACPACYNSGLSASSRFPGHVDANMKLIK